VSNDYAIKKNKRFYAIMTPNSDDWQGRIDLSAKTTYKMIGIDKTKRKESPGGSSDTKQ
jgi:hypothetical protein